MCECINVEIGSYDNQVILDTPRHLLKVRNGRKQTCIDKCIAKEIQWLWSMGITTLGCCCGHNKNDGYIQVTQKDCSKMIKLNYKYENKKIWSFYPLTGGIK